MEEWRNFLYPIGFLANLLFTLRFFLQWIDSEQKAQSHFSLSFWSISLGGSILMALHSFIQLQLFICLIQTCNTILYWRNWQLSQYPKKSLISIDKVYLIFVLLIVSVTAAFVTESYLSLGQMKWMRIPDFMESQKITVSWIWNTIGFFGTFLFASRFWFHWWQAEKNQDNPPHPYFWVISLIGSIFALAYFIRIYDLVNIIGYSAGMIPYLRNLFLLKKQSLATHNLNLK